MKAIFNAKYYYEAGSFADPEAGSKYGIEHIRVEPHPVKGALVIATNGHILGIWHDEWGQCAQPILIRYDETLDAVCGMMDNEWESAPFRCMQINDDDTVTMMGGLVGDDSSYRPGDPVAIFHSLIVEAQFPTWRKVLPAAETPRMDINPRYVDLLGRLSEKDYPRLAVWISPYSGEEGKTDMPAVVKVDGRDDFVGVVMGTVPSSAEWPGEYFDLLRKNVSPVGDKP